MHNPDRSMLGIQGHGMLHTCGTFQSGHHGSLEHADGAHLSYLFRAAPSTKRSGRSGLASHQRPNTTRSTAPSFMASSPRGLVKPPAARNAPCVPRQHIRWRSRILAQAVLMPYTALSNPHFLL